MTTYSEGPASASRTVAIETHGCKLNQADSAALAEEFAAAGFTLVAPDQPADVFVLNTCTVTHVADRKARQAIRAARRRSPGATIVAAGCYAQRSPQAVRAMSEVDLAAGNVAKPHLVRMVVDRVGDGPPALDALAGPEAGSPVLFRTRAAVKIQEGCDQVCAYCIVPRVRGRERSVPPEEVVARVSWYHSLGHQEVVLTGTQLGSYGFDLAGADLADLLAQVLKGTTIPRLRVSSLQPQELGDRLLALWAGGRLCPHFHMPLQSGSDAVLLRMRRRYTAGQYVEAVDRIRRALPDAAITADVIAGFPGETEADYEETLGLCRRVGFSALHVFPFSARPGTSAAHFRDQVDPQTRSRRVQALLELAEEQAAAFRDGVLGTVMPVLWERGHSGAASRDRRWMGLTDSYVRVSTASVQNLANRITPARLTRRHGDMVEAEVC